MKCKLVYIFTLAGLMTPVLAASAPATLEMHVMRAISQQQKQQQKQQKDDFSAQFNNLRKQYPAHKQEITDIEKVHERLLKDAERSLVLAHHYMHYMRQMIPTLADLWAAVEKIKEPALKQACIKLLNHGYQYSTVRDHPSTYSYRANLYHMASVAIEEENDYFCPYWPNWAEWYKQFDWKPSGK